MKDKVVIITGGASGIGRATAIAFAREGATVVIGDLDKAGGENTASAVKATGANATFMSVDVGTPADVQALVARTVEQFGGLDYAFNNAGLVGSYAGIVDTPI